MSAEPEFPRLVALACHDLRTPLATVHGFARTLRRTDLGDPGGRYVEMIEAASLQLAELLEELALVTKIESGRYEPQLEERDSLELARAAAAELGDDTVAVSGTGAAVRVDGQAASRSVRQLARAARRHGGLESVDLVVAGAELSIAPVGNSASGVVLGEELRELGAATAVRALRAAGGSVSLEGERLVVRLPAATTV